MFYPEYICIATLLTVPWIMVIVGEDIDVTLNDDEKYNKFINIPDNYTNPETALLKHLFAAYDRNARPAIRPEEPVHVGVIFVLGRIEDLDEKSQKMTSFGWLPLRWSDPSLRWKPELFSNVTTLSVVSDKIWMPEISLLNGASETGDLALKENSFRANMHYTGKISFEPNIRWITSCKVNLVKFPFDEQHCYINITSFTFGIDRVIFHPLITKVILVYFEENGEWIVTNSTTGAFKIKTEDDSYLGVVFAEIVLKRRPIFYVLNIMLPSITISLFSIFLFILPIESGERVSLGISVVISYSVITLMIGDTMPSSGIKLPVLFIFVTECMVLTSVCVMASVINMHVHHMDETNVIAGFWKIVIVEIIGRIVLITEFRPVLCQSSKGNGIESMTGDHTLRNYVPRDYVGTPIVGDTPTPDWMRVRSISVQPFIDATEARVQASSARGERALNPLLSAPVQWRSVARILDRFFALLAFLALVSMTMWLSVKLRH